MATCTTVSSRAMTALERPDCGLDWPLVAELRRPQSTLSRRRLPRTGQPRSDKADGLRDAQRQPARKESAGNPKEAADGRGFPGDLRDPQDRVPSTL